MSTQRTRIKQPEMFSYTPIDFQKKLYVNGVPIAGDPAGVYHYAGTIYSSRPSGYESMVDVVGNPLGINPCAHDTVTVTCPPAYGKYEMEPPPPNGWRLKSDTYQYNIGLYLYGRRTHAYNYTLPSLAIARVPAMVREDLSGLVDLIEMREIVESGAAKLLFGIANLAYHAWKGELAKSKKAAARLRKELIGQSPAGVIKALIGADLELKFGWKPFVADLKAAVNAFERASKIRAGLVKGTRVFGTAQETIDEVLNFDATVDTNGDPGLGLINIRGQKRTTYKVTASIVRRIRANHWGPEWQLDAELMAELLGLNPSFKKGWELKPLSFVIDWIIPIGDSIEAMEGMSAPDSSWIESYDGMLTHKWTTRLSASGSVVPAAYCSAVASGVVDYTTYSRYPHTLEGVPPVYMPPIHWPQKVGYWWSGLEIILQRMLK